MRFYVKFFVKNILFVSVLFLFFSCSKIVYVEDVSGSRLSKINVKENRNDILVIDTRSYDKYKTGHLNYAINIPFEEMEKRISDIADKRDTSIYIYDENDDLSFKAAEILVKHRFSKVFNAEGLSQYNYPLVQYDIIRANEIKKYQINNNAVLIDYRTEQAYMDGHFSGAVSIPIGHISECIDILPEDKNQMVIFYCNTGISSVWGAEELVNMGYTSVAAVLEGILDKEFQNVMNQE